MEQKKGVLCGLAKALNAGGSAIVTVYDAGAILIDGAYKFVKETTSEIPDKAKSIVGSGIVTILPGEKGKLQGKISEYRKKLKKIYYEIGEKSSKYSIEGSVLEAEEIKGLISNVREYESEISKMKACLIEIEEKEREERERKRALKEKISIEKRKGKVIDEQTLMSIKSAVIDDLKIWLEQKRYLDREIPSPEPVVAEEITSVQEKAETAEETVSAPEPVAAEEATTLEQAISIEEKPEAPAEEIWPTQEPAAAEEATTVEQAEVVEEKPEETSVSYTHEELNSMLKADLLEMCKEKGIECDKTFTKIEIIKMIMEKQM